MTKSLKTNTFLAAEVSINIANTKENATIEPLTLQSIIIIEGISNMYWIDIVGKVALNTIRQWYCLYLR